MERHLSGHSALSYVVHSPEVLTMAERWIGECITRQEMEIDGPVQGPAGGTK